MRPKSSFLVLLVCVTSVQAWGVKAPKPKPTRPEYCEKPPFLGSCQPIVRHWYYDTTAKRCQQISVGLCPTGSNWFVSEEKCKTVCERVTKDVPVACLKPPVTVSCGQVRHAWYFDRNSTTCKMLSYTDPACDSAGNRFLTEMKCQGVCLPTVKPKPICSMDPEPDRCFLSKKQWFFNFRNNTCMKFQKGCGKGANSFSTYDKCIWMCSYNQATAAFPTGKQILQNKQPPLGKPDVPNQVGPVSPPALPVQPSIPVQPGQPSKPGLGLPNQPGPSGLPLLSAGSSQPGKPSLIGPPGQASSTLPPSTPAQSRQSSSIPSAGLPVQQGISTQSRGPAQPVQPGARGKPGQVSPFSPPSTSAQSGQSSGTGVSLPSHPALPGLFPHSSVPSQRYQIGSTGTPGQANSNFSPSTSALSGQSSRAGVGVPSHSGQPGRPSTPPLSGQPSGHGMRLPGHAGPAPLPGPTRQPGGTSLSPGGTFQNNQPFLSGTARQPQVAKQFRPYRSTNR